MAVWVADALRRRDDGIDLPFVILDRSQNRIIGETRLIDYLPEHRQIEIAWTWLAPRAWGHGYGTEHARDGEWAAVAKKSCEGCHTPEFDPDFDYATDWAKIAH